MVTDLSTTFFKIVTLLAVFFRQVSKLPAAFLTRVPPKVSRYKFQVAGDVEVYMQNFIFTPGSAEQVVIFRKYFN